MPAPAAVAGALAASAASAALLAAGALARPQGNVARAVPYAVALAAVWVAAVALARGAVPALRLLAAVATLGALALVAYVVAVEPIPHAECGTLLEELGNRGCRAHASTGLAVAGVVVAAGSAVASFRLAGGTARQAG